MTATDTRDISQCSLNLGFHAFMAGPCFDTKKEAIDYRDKLDALGVKWWPQGEYLPDKRQPAGIGDTE